MHMSYHRYGSTPLILACHQGHSRLARRLLNVPGINAGLVDSQGNTALHYAAKRNRASIISALIQDPDLDVNPLNHDNHTPLYLAVAAGHLDAVARLLEADDLDLYETDQRDRSVLHLAAQLGRESIMAALLAFHPEMELDVEDGDGHTPLWHACRMGMVGVAELLLDHGACASYQGEYHGQVLTSLMVAAKHGHDDIVEVRRGWKWRWGVGWWGLDGGGGGGGWMGWHPRAVRMAAGTCILCRGRRPGGACGHAIFTPF